MAGIGITFRNIMAGITFRNITAGYVKSSGS
jgi:hypothetical protein